jgi:hypothetical protein
MGALEQYYEFDVTAAITSSPDDQTITLVLVGNTLENGARFTDNESDTPPELIIESLTPPPPPPKMTVFVDDQDVTTLVGAQIVKVVISDPRLQDIDEAREEPDVTVNADALRMVQETSGNWFGYFSDRDSALIADSQVVTPGTGSDFGVFCSPSSGLVLGPSVFVTDTAGFAIQDPALVTGEVNGNPDATPLSNLCTDPVPNVTPNDLMNVLDAGTMTPAGLPLQGQIGVRDGFWPFIQLYTFQEPPVTVPVHIVYNIPGEPPEKIILTFVSVP